MLFWNGKEWELLSQWMELIRISSCLLLISPINRNTKFSYLKCSTLHPSPICTDSPLPMSSKMPSSTRFLLYPSFSPWVTCPDICNFFFLSLATATLLVFIISPLAYYIVIAFKNRCLCFWYLALFKLHTAVSYFSTQQT